MCAVVGVIGKSPVNQLLYDSLLLLQHRGQEAAGIATLHNNKFYLYKSKGLVKDVFHKEAMLSLLGHSGIGHVRYSTAGSSSSEEAQPFYVNSPFGITLSHNGNLTNTDELREYLYKNSKRHINTTSDSELLINIFADELSYASLNFNYINDDIIFKAVSELHKKVRGAYSVILEISGYGIVAFKDPYGIRPLCFGYQNTEKGKEWMIASESVALEGNGFNIVRDVNPGEAIIINLNGDFSHKQCANNPKLIPCLFEYVYFARPDSLMNNVSIYEARLCMGEYLAMQVAKTINLMDIDIVVPIPDSSRPSAMQLANFLNINYREALIKNRYIGRTFIMPGHSSRRKSVKQKLNAIGSEFKNKNVLLVDDSIVRGNTSLEIVEMVRAAGAKKVYFASAAPQVKFPNVYGIDMPNKTELIAHNKTNEEIAKSIKADRVIYQNIDDLKKSIQKFNNSINEFDASCFDGKYITGDIDDNYFNKISNRNN
ncbi:Amidophosphoribosyltransferase [Candidatus Kinetoplastibacterium sorsogonicusi]|uniref:Amidophosphoribosyltransferase n=1 Tax=Candidatus Kinetoplastidibacterium kentomonadis TaxID=1576550 RepID=A0A3Q8ERI7_9PROT|nr:amidophosphoribosyltransferase [Candidatus Kinetoplastibacterium sorsogonicusi]AWD32420.1 Amidophosphoribosyltransferase [Candidatus Kinetoplastibacterium sorsogonicusi]